MLERGKTLSVVFRRGSGLVGFIKHHVVANAPHIPIHLGSMSESTRTVIRENAGRMKPGDVFCVNARYNGGTQTTVGFSQARPVTLQRRSTAAGLT